MKVILQFVITTNGCTKSTRLLCYWTKLPTRDLVSMIMLLAYSCVRSRGCSLA